MSALLKLFNLRDNPVFHRFRRSQLRLKSSIAWLLLTLILTTFVVALAYIIETRMANMPEQFAARSIWLPLLIIQGAIVLLKGTGKTASGLIQDKIDQTLDYQRLTPVSPLRNVIGYLFGLPLLEYVMFALTLPHLAFIVIKGEIPILTVVSVYTTFFVCAIFYHMTAIAVGMVMKRWVLGYLLSIFSVAFLNLFLPTVAPQLGLKFLQYLSILPVIGQKVAPLLAGQFTGNPGSFGPAGGPPPGGPNPVTLSGIEFAQSVPFFDWTLSPFFFTLLLQAGLIVTLATMAVRRWKKENKHSLSKPYALGMLCVFIVLVAGNVWPAITGDYLPFSLFGRTSLEALSDFLAIGLPLVYALAVWLLCLFLYSNTVPSHHAYVRGVRRAAKLGRRAAAPWDDDAANIPFMSLFTLASLVGYWVLVSRMDAAGFYDFLAGTEFSPLRLPFALMLVLIYSLLLLQVLQQRGTVIAVLLLWLVPILIAIVITASTQEITRLQTVLASLSPLAVLIMGGLLPLEPVVPIEQSSEFAAALTGFRTGVVFLLLQIALLAYRWRQLRQALR